MPALTLTASVVERAQGPTELRDTKVPGLICRVRDSGRKTFEVALKRRGVRWSKKLGAWPHMTLTMAREQAQSLLGAEIAKLPVARADRLQGSMTLREFASEQYFPKTHLGGEAEARRVLGLDRDQLADKGRKADNLTWAELLEKPLRDIRRGDIEGIRSKWVKAGAAPATVNRKCTVLRAVLSRACEWHELVEHPMRGIKPVRVEDDARTRTFTDAERGRLYGVVDAQDCKPEVGTAIYIMLNTGVRPGREVQRLRTDLKAGVVTIPTTTTSKAAKARQVPINPTLAERLRKFKTWRCPTRKEFDAVMHRARVEDAIPYTARHDFLSRLANNGVPPHVLMKLAGHSTITITMKYYTHTEADALRAAVQRI